MSNSTRIAKNTIALYFRQILIMLVSLYTVRVVLATLGAEDYGIYNVVAGVVTMFGFLSGAMATASQRYFSFDLGKGDTEHLKTTFSVTFQIYLLIIAVVVLIAETFGLWFVNNKLVIPAERMTAANWIYQAAIVSFVLTLVTTPYMASIIAHENMKVYAYVSIVEAVLKLGIVFLLKVLPFDKLSLYGVLLAAVAFVLLGQAAAIVLVMPAGMLVYLHAYYYCSIILCIAYILNRMRTRKNLQEDVSVEKL